MRRTLLAAAFVCLIGFAVSASWHWLVVEHITEPEVRQAANLLEGGVYAGLVALVVFLLAGQREAALRREHAALLAQRDVESRYKSFFDQSPDGVLVVDLETRRAIDFNDAAARQLGYTRQEFARLEIGDYEAVESPEQTHARIERLRVKGHDEFLTKHRTSAGETLDVRVTVSLVAHGGRQLAHCIMRDVTETRRLEEARQEQARSQQTLLANLPGMAYRCRNDPDWTMEFMSQGAHNLTGYAVDEFLDNRVLSYNDVIHPDDQKSVWEGVQEGIARRAPYLLTYRIRTRSGEERWVWEQGQGVFGESGELRFLEGYITDISELRRAQDGLRESERRFRTLLEGVELVAVVLDVDGRISFCNDHLLKVTGRDRDEVIGSDWFALFVPPAECERIADVFRRTIATGEVPAHFENPILTRSGEQRLVRWNNTILRNPEGRIVGTASLGEDVTEARRALMALDASETRFRHLVQGLNAVFWEANADPLAFTFVSERAEPLLGYPVAAWLESIQFWIDHIHPEDRAWVPTTCGAATAEGRDHELEYRFLAADGRTVWLRDIVRVQTDASGRPSRLIGLMVDITDLKEAQREAAEQRAQLGAIVESAMDSIVTADENGRIVVFNAAAERLFQIQAAEAIGSPLETFIPGRFRAEHPARMAGIAGQPGRRLVNPRCIGLRADGSEVPLESSLSQIELGGHRLYTAISRDVTERNRVENERRRNEDRLRFALDLSRRTARLTEEQILQECTEQAALLTDSRIAYLHTVESDQQSIRLVAWNQEALRGCTIPAERQYPLGAAGVWADAARLGRPVMHNDYQHLPGRKGYPEGHCHVERHLSVPVLDGDQVRLILGVGNKPTDYDEADTRLLEELANDVQRLVMRKRAEDALRTSEARFRALFENAPEAIVVVDVDQGRFVDANENACRFFKLSRSELLTKGPVELSPPLAPDGRPSAEVARERLLQALDETPRFEWTHVDSEGKSIPCEINLTRLPSSKGTLVRGSMLDVSARRKAEENQQRLRQALEAAADEWRRTFDAMQAVVILLDSRHRVLRANAATGALLGRSPEALVGDALASLGSGEPWNSIQSILAVPDGESAGLHRVHDAETGRCWDVRQTRLAPDGRDDGRIILSFQETTELARLESAALQAERFAAMGAVTAGVAHEVRNPLFAISANVDALTEELRDRPDVSELLGAVQSQVSRLSSLMEELLDYGKPALAVPGLRRLDEALATALPACDPLARAAGIALVREGDSPTFPVRMDADRVGELIEKLVENAIQHAPRGSKVRVKVDWFSEADANWVRCAVLDDGPGFPEADLPRVFEPFFSRRRGGTGLGLAIAQRIAEQHGGRLLARNRPGGGAAVVLELPAAAPEPTPAGRSLGGRARA